MKQRIASVDIMRGLTMLTMLFVNDFAGMSNIPHRLHHAAIFEDMLGYSDLVFPAFMFCVGMSIPFAVGARYKRGDNDVQVLWHVIKRAIALIIMGLCAMNMGGVGVLSHSLIMVLSTIAFFMIWNVYPKKEGKTPWWAVLLQCLGAAILIGILIYKELNGIHYRVGWWGILGLIGWTYLLTSFIFVFTRGNVRPLVIAFVIAAILCVLSFVSFIPSGSTYKWLIGAWIPGCWANHSLGIAGCLTSVLMLKYADDEHPKKYMTILFSWAILMLLAGISCRYGWIISKDLATPTWMFFCLSVFLPIFAIIYFVADVRGCTKWARPISPAGQSTLTCYMIPYLWYGIQQLLGLHYPEALRNGYLGLTKALVFSCIIIALTWLFNKCKIKIKV